MQALFILESFYQILLLYYVVLLIQFQVFQYSDDICFQNLKILTNFFVSKLQFCCRASEQELKFSRLLKQLY